MKLNFKIVRRITVIVAGAVVIASCDSNPNSSGLEYMPDMYRSAAIEPYVDYGEVREERNPILRHTLSAKVPPFGAIPYYGTNTEEVMLMLPYHRLPNSAFRLTHGLVNVEFTNENTYEAAAADMNPLKLTEVNAEDMFKKGKELFTSQCMHCHGEKGDGNGSMVASGIYAGVPDYANLKNLSDGQMFYSIYYGKGMMGAHGPTLNKREIWTLVHYIRKFQDSNYGMAGAVSDSTLVVADSVTVGQ